MYGIIRILYAYTNVGGSHSCECRVFKLCSEVEVRENLLHSLALLLKLYEMLLNLLLLNSPFVLSLLSFGISFHLIYLLGSLNGNAHFKSLFLVISIVIVYSLSKSLVVHILRIETVLTSHNLYSRGHLTESFLGTLLRLQARSDNSLHLLVILGISHNLFPTHTGRCLSLCIFRGGFLFGSSGFYLGLLFLSHLCGLCRLCGHFRGYLTRTFAYFTFGNTQFPQSLLGGSSRIIARGCARLSAFASGAFTCEKLKIKLKVFIH